MKRPENYVTLAKLKEKSLNFLSQNARSFQYMSFFEIPFLRPLRTIFKHYIIKLKKYIVYVEFYCEL